MVHEPASRRAQRANDLLQSVLEARVNLRGSDELLDAVRLAPELGVADDRVAGPYRRGAAEDGLVVALEASAAAVTAQTADQTGLLLVVLGKYLLYFAANLFPPETDSTQDSGAASNSDDACARLDAVSLPPQHFGEAASGKFALRHFFPSSTPSLNVRVRGCVFLNQRGTVKLEEEGLCSFFLQKAAKASYRSCFSPQAKQKSCC